MTPLQAGLLTVPASIGVGAGHGLTNPVPSYGLASASDWSTQMPFLDIAHNMRKWIGFKPGPWGGMDYPEIAAGGYLDASGWPKKIPPGLASVGSIWASDRGTAADRMGGYGLTYEGEGTINMGNVRVRSAAPGRILFENPQGNSMWFNITATDPQNSGNYIRDISMVHEKNLAFHKAGAIFNPDGLAVIDHARDLRLKDWMGTNNATIVSWADGTEPGDFTWAKASVAPAEIMVRLANETGTDPWFTMPHIADDEYFRRFATYVRDNLDPRLKAQVEYSNEVWNGAFQQFHWIVARSKVEWGVEAPFDFYAKRATETAAIWEEVFGAAADARLVNILGTQNANPDIAERQLAAKIRAAKDPEGVVAPGSAFEALATTTYFGNSTMADAGLRNALLAAIKNLKVDASISSPTA